MEKRSFTKFWIIIATAFVFVGMILVAWFLTFAATKEDILEKYNQQQLLLVEGTAVGIEGLFNDLAVSLGSLGNLPHIQYFDEPVVRGELNRKLEEISPLGITDIMILDADGTARFNAIDIETEGIDFSWRSYFREALQRNFDDSSDQLIIELQSTHQGKLGFKIAVPFFETTIYSDRPSPSGDFAGVIVGNLTLDTLVQRHIEPFKPAGDGHIFLVNEEYDIVWSSDEGMNRANILDRSQRALSEMADQMESWEQGASRGNLYEYESAQGWNNLDLIAFAPVSIAGELMVVGVITPEEVARQTSLSNFQTQQFIFIISVVTIFVGVLVGAQVLGREIRRRFQVEEALRVSEMSQAIIKERNRLAGDLHDSVTQGLYGIVLHAGAAEGQLSSGNTSQTEEYLKEIKTAGKEALAEMRLLIFELRPPVLEREGLQSALETRLYAVEKRSGLNAELQSEIEGRLPLEVEEGLFRIAQEALNNALKHAQASNILVRLNQVGSAVTLEVSDDGRGFDLDKANKSGGLGLTSMGERASNLPGTLSIQSKPEQGTSVVVEVTV
jgi:signal transduction histidine kinase